MTSFACTNCGCISENPKPEFHPDKDAEFRTIRDNMIARAESITIFFTGRDRWQEAWFESEKQKLKFKYNHSITCPVCHGITTFWIEWETKEKK